MADLADIQDSFPDKSLFHVACQDVARITCILSFHTSNIVKPKHLNSWSNSIYEKLVFLYRFVYLLFCTGFMPTIFDLLPFKMWQIVTIMIYGYRWFVMPFYLRLIGYSKHADWSSLGTHQPAKDAPETKVYQNISDTTYQTNLSKIQFGDPDFEKFITFLYNKGAHYAPHSQSPGNPLAHNNFPGNFMNHLTGVYKILVAWKQPQYVCRAGMFHSIYGTFDYRTNEYCDLRNGRSYMQKLIGVGAEELAFAICTSDRLLLIREIRDTMYGKENAELALRDNYVEQYNQGKDGLVDGNPHPQLVNYLTESGYPVRNHITQKVHIFPPDFFAQFVVVFCADFMDQGAAGPGSADYDICIFQFQRYRFFNDIICFVKDYLRVVPPVWSKYMGNNAFIEPTRSEILALKDMWVTHVSGFVERKGAALPCKAEARELLVHCIKAYPWMLETFVILGCCLRKGEILEVSTI